MMAHYKYKSNRTCFCDTSVGIDWNPVPVMNVVSRDLAKIQNCHDECRVWNIVMSRVGLGGEELVLVRI